MSDWPITSRMALSADGLHGAVRIFHVEDVFAGVVDLPEDGEIDVDDVLVAGQHQALFRDVAAAAAANRPGRMVTRLTVVTSGVYTVSIGYGRRKLSPGSALRL